MTQPAHKEAWVTPELIVLVRSKPEEAVLTACKGAFASVAPTDFNDTCDLADAACTWCDLNTAS